MPGVIKPDRPANVSPSRVFPRLQFKSVTLLFCLPPPRSFPSPRFVSSPFPSRTCVARAYFCPSRPPIPSGSFPFSQRNGKERKQDLRRRGPPLFLSLSLVITIIIESFQSFLSFSLHGNSFDVLNIFVEVSRISIFFSVSFGTKTLETAPFESSV